MALRHASNIESFITAVETLETGDTVEVDGFDSAASSTAELLDGICCIADCGADFVSLRERVDTRNDIEKVFFTVCRALYALDEGKNKPRRRDGIEKAKAEGRYKGRKPIAVDESLFDSVVTLWQGGQITAREAMSRLNLKPNTFYRRIKEREEQKMKDYKMAQREIRDEIRAAAKQSRRDLGDLRKQIHEEAKEVKKAADEKLELRDVEREIRRGRIYAEAEHQDAVRQMKKDVESEAKELKQLLKEAETSSPAEESK